MAPLRPRDRKWTVEKTWKGCGRHGEGGWDKGMQLETLEALVIGVDGLDASAESVDRLEELVGDEEVDRGVGDPLLEDPPLHLHL